MHTFDGVNLLGLDQKVKRADGSKLKISIPVVDNGPLFDEKKDGTNR
jgi:hypothetical protein